MKNTFLLLIACLLLSNKPLTDSKPAMKELNVDYFMDNHAKPKNEIWVCYFWATWCANCVKSHEVLSGLNQEFKDKQVRMISLSLDKKKSKLEAFIAEHPSDWEQVYLADTPFDKSFKKAFGDVTNLPQLFIIDKTGKATRVKYLNQLKSELQKVLEQEME